MFSSNWVLGALVGFFSNLDSVSLWLQGGLVMLWLGFVLSTAIAVHRVWQTDPEISRKIVHIGTGNIILLAWWLHTPAILGIMAAVIACIVTLVSYRLPILPGINSIGRKSLGTFFYSLSIGILIAGFWSIQQPFYAALGILIMAWGDGLAALVGKRFGKHKYKIFGGQKSWEGSLTMAVTSYIICSFILLSIQGFIWQTWLVALVVAVCAAALEVFSFLGIDNLTVPLGSSAIAFAFNWYLTSM